jgi:SAM-dependent methyltransferase
MISGYWMSQAIYVAARLELADHIAAGRGHVDALAEATRTAPDPLFRLLRALASVGVFQEGAPRHFAPTPASELLRRDTPGSQWAMAVMMGEEHYTAWGQLLESIRTGEGAFRREFGQPIFEYLAGRPEAARIFDAAMTSIHGRETGPMVEAYDFGGCPLVIDVGGGNGSLLTALLGRYPTVRGLVYDLPHVVERGAASLAEHPLAGRLDWEAGNFFERVPAGGDVYLLRHIIHDWHDDQAITILRHCAAALKPTARVIVAESVIPAGNDWHFAKWLDLTMLVIPEGRERTADEYQALFDAAGLRLIEIRPTGGDIDLLVAGPKA